MIELITGTPGSGKSLMAAGMIRDALNKRRGADRPVIANFEVNTAGTRRPQAFHYFDNQTLTPALLCEFADDFWASTDRRFSEDYVIVCIDEAQLLWNSRSWQDKGRRVMQGGQSKSLGDSRMDWLEFMSQHRKYGIKLVLMAQNAKMIDNQFRFLIDDEVNCRKVSKMGAIGGLIGLFFGGKLFMRVRYLFQSHERLGMQLYVMNKKDAAMYDSYARFKKIEK